MAENEGLPKVFGVVIEVPVSYTAEITAVGVLGDFVEIVEDMFDVIPILHQKAIGLIDDYKFDGGKEIVIALFVGFITDG